MTVSTSTAPNADDEQDRKFEARYGKLLVSRGIATFPSLLLRWQEALGLEDRHVVFIVAIFSFYIEAGNWPSVSVDAMSKWRGVSSESIDKMIGELEARGYLVRPGRDARHGNSYFYDLSGLLEALRVVAKVEEQDREERVRSGVRREEALRTLNAVDRTNRDPDSDAIVNDEVEDPTGSD